jgi:hypothetical protein
MAYFQTQIPQLGNTLEVLAMEDVGLFCGHLVYFTAIWSVLCPFGIFFPFWYDAPRKIWQP